MTTKRITKIAVFVGMMIAVAVIVPPINIPGFPVPFTLQVLVIMLIGLTMTPLDSFLTLFIYLLMGVLGLPIFSGGTSGFVGLFGFTGGFLMAFPFLAFAISFVRKSGDSFFRLFLKMEMMTVLILYPIAGIWMIFVYDFTVLTTLTFMLPFVLFDSIKAFLAISIFKRLPKPFYEVTQK